MTMLKTQRWRVASACLGLTLASISPACSGLTNANEEDDTLLFAAVAYLVLPGYALDSSTGCISGVVSSMDSALPAWIRNNFKCAVGAVSGANHMFTSKNLPNTKSFYYGAGQPLYEDLPAGNSASGSTRLIAQNLTYTIPATPTVNGGPKTSTSGLAAVGMTVNGLAIFNNAAESGGALSTEVSSFDNFNGHVTTGGVYHHHIDPKNITTNDAALVGIALDGYPIYGQLCDQATTSTADDAAPGTGTPALDIRHGHAANTVLFPGGIYHYHFAFDGTAAMNTLMGSNFHGNVGSVTNN